VLVHGAAGDHTVWALQTRYLAHQGRNVLAVDLPGHGRSEGAAMGSIADMADWLVRLLDAAGVRQAGVAGHSMGGLVALDAGSRHGERIRSLALLGTAVPMPVNDAFLSLAEAGDHRAIEMMMDWAHGPRAHIGGNKVPGLHLIWGAMRLIERAGPGVLHADLKACDDYRGGEEAAANLHCPVTLILGGRDVMTPASAGRRIAELYPAARVETLPGVGHMMMTEAPDRVRELLDEAV
jgi:pimeloyl-ACP methyl ester carboxylesterase